MTTTRDGMSAGRYRDVLAIPEFRALFGASLLSQLGDQLARVAVAVLVFTQTRSTLLAATTFGLSYGTWVLCGPLLSVVPDRFPRRAVMVGCDVARTVLLGLLALPGLPIPVMIGLLVVAALLEPPFRAARSATMPDVLRGDLLAAGNGLSHLSMQLAQVLGFAAGGAIVALVSARGAILADGATFATSAVLIGVFVRHRAVPAARPSRGWTRTAGEGFRLVFRDDVLRANLVLAWIGAAAITAPEGLMTSLAGHLQGGPRLTGALLAATPCGTFIGVVLYVRLTPPARRRRLIRRAEHLVRPDGPCQPPRAGLRRCRERDNGQSGGGYRRGRRPGRCTRRSCHGGVAVRAGRRRRHAADTPPLARRCQGGAACPFSTRAA